MSRIYRNFLGALFCLLLMLCLAPAAWAVQGSTVGELQAAIQNGDTVFTLNDDMSITDGFFDGRYGLTLIVPENTTLEITAGTVELSGLNLSGGQLNLHGGIFRVNQSFTYTGGSVHVYGCWNLFPAADVLSYNNYETIFSHERADGDNTKLLFNVTTEEDFVDAVTAVNNLNSFLIPRRFLECTGAEIAQRLRKRHIRQGFTACEKAAVPNLLYPLAEHKSLQRRLTAKGYRIQRFHRAGKCKARDLFRVSKCVGEISISSFLGDLHIPTAAFIVNIGSVIMADHEIPDTLFRSVTVSHDVA